MKRNQKSKPAYFALLESEVTQAFRDIVAKQNALLDATENLNAQDKKAFRFLEKQREREIHKLYDAYPMNPIVIDWYADTLTDVAEIRSLKELAKAVLPLDDPMRAVIAAELAEL